jgi:hypothetical protein
MLLLNGKRIERIDIPAHCEMSKKLQAHARGVLRKNLRECPNYATDAMDADVIIEQVWNALTGLDKPARR